MIFLVSKTTYKMLTFNTYKVYNKAGIDLKFCYGDYLDKVEAYHAVMSAWKENGDEREQKKSNVIHVSYDTCNVS